MVKEIKKQEKDEIILVGDFDWNTTRYFLIKELMECETEQQFIKIMMSIHKSIGTQKELEKTRKELDIHPFTKRDLYKMTRIDERKNVKNKNFNMTNIYITGEEYWMKVNNLIDKIKQQNLDYDGVYGVPTGGLPIAVAIHQQLHLPLLLSPTPSCLLVDDISDNGITLYHLPHKKIATLFTTPWTISTPDFWVDTKTNKNSWIVFPYEEVIGNE